MIVKNQTDMTKAEFAYMYRQEIAEFIKAGCNCAWINKECRSFIKFVVRRMLKYSFNTADVDIFNSIQSNYKRLIF